MAQPNSADEDPAYTGDLIDDQDTMENLPPAHTGSVPKDEGDGGHE